MNNQHTLNPTATTGMLIRKPITEVFEAFIDPSITSKFWFTKSTGRLEEGAQIEWTWEMYNVKVPVVVKEITPNKKIVVEWGNYQNMSKIEWAFTDLGEKGAYVSITNSGFQGTTTELFSQVSDSTKGFTFLLSGAKAFLEYGIQLNLTTDAFPKEIYQANA